MRTYIPAAAGTAGHDETPEPVGVAPEISVPRSLTKFRVQASVKDRLKWLEGLSQRATSTARSGVVSVKRGAATEAKLRYLQVLAQKSEAAVKSPIFTAVKAASAAKAEYLAAVRGPHAALNQPDSPQLSPVRMDAKSAYFAATVEKRHFDDSDESKKNVEPPAKISGSLVSERLKVLLLFSEIIRGIADFYFF